MKYLKKFNENNDQKLFTIDGEISFYPNYFDKWKTCSNHYSDGVDFVSKMDEELIISFFINEISLTKYFFQFDWYSTYAKNSKVYTIEIGHNPTIDDVKDILEKSLIFRENYDIIMKNKDELDDYPDYDQLESVTFSMRTFERFINKLQIFKVKYDYLYTGKDMGLL